jgi:ferredoxin
MSEQNERFDDNIDGKYYITKSCIGCTLCSVIAPDNFTENTDEELAVGHCYVYKQSETEAEALTCEEAMDVCPADAIRNNGSSNV